MKTKLLQNENDLELIDNMIAKRKWKKIKAILVPVSYEKHII